MTHNSKFQAQSL